MRWVGTEEYLRVQRRAAEKLYNKGEVVYMCACKIRPGSPWRPEIAVCLADDDGVSFGKIVDSITAYNCNNADGKYPAFYVKRPD